MYSIGSVVSSRDVVAKRAGRDTLRIPSSVGGSFGIESMSIPLSASAALQDSGGEYFSMIDWKTVSLPSRSPNWHLGLVHLCVDVPHCTESHNSPDSQHRVGNNLVFT